MEDKPEHHDRHASTPEGIGWGVVIDIFQVLDEHGYKRGSDADISRAVNLAGQLVRAYTGT